VVFVLMDLHSGHPGQASQTSRTAFYACGPGSPALPPVFGKAKERPGHHAPLLWRVFGNSAAMLAPLASERDFNQRSHEILSY